MVYHLLILLLLIANPGGSEVSKISPSQLTCEYLSNPSVVDVLQPRLAWKNFSPSKARGEKQTAYQIRVASSIEQLKTPDLWDSEKVESSRIHKGTI